MWITYSGQTWKKEKGKNKSFGESKSISRSASSGNLYSDKAFVNIPQIIFFVCLCFFCVFFYFFQHFMEDEVCLMLLQRCLDRSYSLLGKKRRPISYAPCVSLAKIFFFFFFKVFIIKQKQILHGHSYPGLSLFLRWFKVL